jgi:hypothetical protein
MYICVHLLLQINNYFFVPRIIHLHIVTSLMALRTKHRDLIPAYEVNFVFSKAFKPVPHPTQPPTGSSFSGWKSGLGVKLNAPFHITPRLRMHGAIFPTQICFRGLMFNYVFRHFTVYQQINSSTTLYFK